MKLRFWLTLGFFGIYTQANAVVFDAYKDSLEADLVCASYPNSELKMHFQMLKETGAISPKSSTPSTSNKPYTFKVNPGFSVYGFPLTSVSMARLLNQKGDLISVDLRAKPADVVAAVKKQALKTGVTSFDFIKEGEEKGSYIGSDKNMNFQIWVAPTKNGGTSLVCTPYYM